MAAVLGGSLCPAGELTEQISLIMAPVELVGAWFSGKHCGLRQVARLHKPVHTASVLISLLHNDLLKQTGKEDIFCTITDKPERRVKK